MSGQSPYMSAAQYGYPSNFQQRDNRYPTNANVDTAMVLNRRPSLLAGYHNHFSSPERTSLAPYAFPLATPVSMGPHVDEHSKRSRHPTTIALSIDIKKEQPLYQPQTEAISPILDEPKIDTNMRDTTIIRNSISKLESEIEITMKRLHRAKLSQSEIKSQADRSAADEEEEHDTQDDLFKINGSQTLIEKILHDNRKKAEDGQKVLNQLHNNVDLSIPLYQEPSDLEPIEKIRTQYMNVMKNRLITLLKKSRERYMCQTKFDSEKYDQTYDQWQKSIEKDEKTILAKDISTYRETFEKTFSELRKAREDKEKKQSTQTPMDASLISSSTEQPTLIIANTTTSIEQENHEEEEDEKMRKSSVIPPILYDSWQRKHQYFNQNGLIKGDAAVFYKEQTKMPYWTGDEKQIFIEKFTQSPKNFGYISSFLENKTTEQCVQFYYMTKKTENYKYLLRKQTQANKRRAKQNPTTTTTTTVTSSTTIETTLVTKVTSNTIVSSTSQQLLAPRQDAERSIERIDNGEERRDTISGDANDEKRLIKNRCQLCSTDKTGRKRTRKTRLRAFPTKWNELSIEHREEIRRVLQIPSDAQRFCTRCYEKVIIQVRERHTNQTGEEDDDESTIAGNTNSKHADEEWNETEIDAFTQALDKFNHDWTQIAEYVHRSEESCRAFYLKQRKNISPDDDPNNDEDNGSISGSELGQSKQVNDSSVLKTVNDDSNDSTQGMVIDEGEEQTLINNEKNTKSIPSTTNFSTITSLVEKEISKTLHETGKRLPNNNLNSSPEIPSINHHTNTITQPPPLVTLNKSQSPATHHQYPSHPQQQYMSKGSIMRGTPLSSATPTNKPIAIDIAPTHPHHYNNNPRGEYSHHKSPKILDRNMEQQHLLQQQHAAYMRHYNQQQQQQQQQHHHHQQQQQYIQQQQQHQQQQQQHKTSTKTEPPSTATFETLRADYVTSKYLTTTATHSPSHERQHRSGPDQRSPSQPISSINQPLLPPPATIAPLTAASTVQPSLHSHHAQQQAALLAASQVLASSGVYPQDLIANSLLPYASYYGSLPAGSPFLFDSRLMHEYNVAANNEQLKAEQYKAAMRFNRHHHHQPPPMSGHSPPDPSYPPHSSKRHSHDLGYPTGDYPTAIWRTQNMTNPAQVHPQMKHNPGTNESPLLKLNDLSRHSSARTAERNSRSPDDYHHRINQPRTVVESPSIHFQRVEAHNHHKSSHEKSNPNLHYADHATEANHLNYIRQASNVHKPQTSHHSPHRSHHQHHHPTTSNTRTLAPPLQNSPHHPAYLIHGHHHPSIDTISPQRQQQQSPHQHHQSHYPQQQQQQQQQHQHQRTSQHTESLKNTKESMSIQEFMNKNVNEFVSSTNNDQKNTSTDSSSHEPSNNQLTRTQQASNSDQPILLDGDDDSNPTDQSDLINKSNSESDMPERRRDSSIKKILSNQPLEKQEYVEINQKVQNSTVGASKVHSNNNEPSGIERSNSMNTRTRSRGSITMRMLMGSSDIYADGKAQPMTSEDQSNKRPASPHDKCEKIEYLIRGELDRACPTLVKHDETANIFQKSSSNQSQQNSSKRLRTSPNDEEQRHSPFPSGHDSATNVRDPFALQSHPKNQHHQLTSSANLDKNWQSFVQQQQQYQLANSHSSPFASQSSHPTGSITHGSPVSPSLRLPAEQQPPHSSATNNQLVNPRYAYNANKNEEQSSPSRQSSTSPHDHSPKTEMARIANQTLASPSDTQQESSVPTSADHPSSSKSPLTNPNTSNTPPMVASSPTSSSSNSAHPLKKRLISEYELEQQRNSPVVATEEISNSSNIDIPKHDTEDVSTAEVADQPVTKPAEETDNST